MGTETFGTPLVSVWMVTYNHEKFIRQAIESVLMQVTDFQIEIIIGEDCSTDGTRKIIEELELQYPDIIKPIYHEKNVGAQRNAYEFCLPELKGKYIACLEGDDYWTDPYKLQKQIDFLEADLSYIGYCHNFKIIDSSNKTLDESFTDFQDKECIDTNDIIAGASIAALTVVFRNVFDQNPLPFITTKLGNQDKMLFSWLSTFGNFFADKQFIAAAYRKHSGGIWSMKPTIYIVQQSILTHEVMFTILPAEFAGAVGRKLAAKKAMLAVLTYRSNKKEFLGKYWLAIKACFRFKALKVFFSLHKILFYK
jgi:glycosyltransferase involved in cell wall biosynthesis